MLLRLSLATATIAFIFIAAYFGGGAHIPETALNFMGIWFLFVVGILVGIRFLLPWRSRRIFKQQKGLQRPHTITWNDDCMTYESEQATARTPWTDFILWRENDVLFMLYFSEVMFRMIPKRAFLGDDSVTSFRELLRNKISSTEGRKRTSE